MRRFLEAAILTAELGALALLIWRQLDPEASPRELLLELRDDALERARYREAIRRTLNSIRALPESEGEA